MFLPHDSPGAGYQFIHFCHFSGGDWVLIYTSTDPIGVLSFPVVHLNRRPNVAKKVDKELRNTSFVMIKRSENGNS